MKVTQYSRSVTNSNVAFAHLHSLRSHCRERERESLPLGTRVMTQFGPGILEAKRETPEGVIW